MRVTVVAECTLSPRNDVEAIEHHADVIMDELLNLEAEDPSVGGALAKGQLEVEVSVESDSLEQALATGASQIRSALHVAGLGTPAWPCDEPTFWLGIGKAPEERPLPA